MVVASFIILTFSLLYDSYIKKGEIVDMLALYTFFMGVKTVVLAWIIMTMIFFSIILITKVSLVARYYIWLPLYIGQIAAIISTAVHFSRVQDLGFGSVIIIMAEAIRMIMKGHSYLRTKLLYLTDNPYRNF
jgi:hypothetical protein